MYFEKRYFSCLSVVVTELRTHGLPQAAKWQQIHIEGLIPGKHWWQRGMRYKSTGKRSQRSWPASGAPRHKIRSTAGQMKQLKCRLPQILFIGGPEKKQGAHAESHLPSCWPEFIAANNVPGFWMLSSRIICSCVRPEQRHVYCVSFLLKLAFAVFIHYRLEWFVWCANEKIDTVMDLQHQHTAGTAHTQNLIDAKRNHSS